MNKNDIISEGEIETVESLLTELQIKKNRQERELQEVNNTIEILQRIQNKSGKTRERSHSRLVSNKKKGIPVSIKKILQEGELHVDEIFKRLKNNKIETTYESVAALLWTYSKNGKIFRKVGRNVYDLIEKEKKNS